MQEVHRLSEKADSSAYIYVKREKNRNQTVHFVVCLLLPFRRKKTQDTEPFITITSSTIYFPLSLSSFYIQILKHGTEWQDPIKFFYCILSLFVFDFLAHFQYGILMIFACCFLFWMFQILFQSSCRLLLRQQRELERRVINFRFCFSFFWGLKFSLIFHFLCALQIIREGFYQTKHVEHKGLVPIFAFLGFFLYLFFLLVVNQGSLILDILVASCDLECRVCVVLSNFFPLKKGELLIKCC